MTKPRPLQWYHYPADLILPDARYLIFICLPDFFYCDGDAVLLEKRKTLLFKAKPWKVFTFLLFKMLISHG